MGYTADNHDTFEVERMQSGDGAAWRAAIALLTSEEDREGELLDLDEAEHALSDDRCYLLLARSAAETVGMLSAFRFPDPQCGGFLVYLYDIEVALKQRRLGIGSALITRLRELCDCDEVDLIWAGTESANSAARALFRTTGAKLDSESYAEYEWQPTPTTR